MNNKKSSISPDKLREMIREEAARAVEAGRMAAYDQPKDAFKAAERRLYAVPTMKARVADLQEEVDEIKAYGVRECHNSFTCYVKGSTRLDPDDIRDVMIQQKEFEIERDKKEIAHMEKALSQIAGERYYLAVYDRYINRLSDDAIAEKLGCDTSTVRRNRSPLVQRIAVWLYGADAV